MQEYRLEDVMSENDREISEVDTSNLVKEFFLGEFVFDQLIYTPKEEKSNLELADVLISYADIVIGFQIKERKTTNGRSEKSWMEDLTKKAKHQVSDTLRQLNEYNLPQFKNRYDENIKLPEEGKFMGIIVLKNSNLEGYKRVVTTKEYDGNINCFEYEDFCKCCKRLLLPQEIIEYLVYRGSVCRQNVISSMNEEDLLDEYLMKKYGTTQFINTTIDIFRKTLKEFKNHAIDKTKEYENREILSVLLKMDRHEAELYCKLLGKTINYAKDKIQQEDLMLMPLRKEKTAHIFISLLEYRHDYIERIMTIFMYLKKVNRCLATVVCFENQEQFAVYHYFKEKEWDYDEILKEICDDPIIKQKWNPRKQTTGKYLPAD